MKLNDTNTKFYEHVLDAMASHNSSLQAHLNLVNPDSSLLADLVVRNLPWPIGIELSRLFSGYLINPDRARLDQIFRTIERTLQFICFTMLCDFFKQREEGNINGLKPEVAKQLQRRLSTLTLGNYIWMIKTIGKHFTDNDISFYMPEINQLCNQRCHALLDFWVPNRNDIGHYKINLPESEIERRCVEYEERLAEIFVNLSFLSQYTLVKVNVVKVQKARCSRAKFEYEMDILNHLNSDFRSVSVMDDKFAESKIVALMKDLQKPSEMLNLSPFILDTNSEVIDSKEKFSIAKDIFMFTRYYRGRLHYSGTEVTTKCDLSKLSNFKELMMEYEHIMQVISQPEKRFLRAS